MFFNFQCTLTTPHNSRNQPTIKDIGGQTLALEQVRDIALSLDSPDCWCGQVSYRSFLKANTLAQWHSVSMAIGVLLFSIMVIMINFVEVAN